MHKLVREVRFSINPFLAEEGQGFNSFASKPPGEGLAIFFELAIGLIGEVDEPTGFVINVVDIDKAVRKFVVPVFAEQVRREYREQRHIGFDKIVELLKLTQQNLKGKFGKALVAELALQLNPYRKLAVDCEDWKMIYFSEKFEFAAMHKLWNNDFSEDKNFEVFGKCANPTGHGHNYIVEVTVKMPTEKNDFRTGEFEKIVSGELIDLIDHKNLNVDVEHFASVIPSVENLAVFSWEKLNEKFDNAKLHCITIWETDKTSCSYYG